MMKTVRQQIVVELEQGPITVRDLSQTTHQSEREILVHLEHVARSVQRPKQFVIEPPVCHQCGFVFSGRHRFSSPSRCPRCRHEGIIPPLFHITAS